MELSEVDQTYGTKGKMTFTLYPDMAYIEKHYYDEVKIDYFAVSLPDLQMFDDDLTSRNRAHCEYLIALSSLGLGDRTRAATCFDAALEIDCAHQSAIVHKQILDAEGN